METVTSADGTPIAYERTGSGPPLVLVHGAAGLDHTTWEQTGARSCFAEHCTVYAIDRRGRGEGGDAEKWTLEREFDDVAAVVDSIDEPVHLFGHSFGALCSLGEALRTDNLRTLILYEPWFAVDDYSIIRELEAEEVLAEMEVLLDDGENEGAFLLFLREILGSTSEDIDERRSASTWSARVDAVHTVIREMNVVDEYEFDATRFADMATPTLLVSGSESPQFVKNITITVDKALPNSQITILEGQGHGGTSAAVDEILAFIHEPS